MVKVTVLVLKYAVFNSSLIIGLYLRHTNKTWVFKPLYVFVQNMQNKL